MMMVQLSRSQIGQKHVHSSDQNCFNCAELMVMWSTRKRKVVWRKGKEAIWRRSRNCKQTSWKQNSETIFRNLKNSMTTMTG